MAAWTQLSGEPLGHLRRSRGDTMRPIFLATLLLVASLLMFPASYGLERGYLDDESVASVSIEACKVGLGDLGKRARFAA